MYVLLTLIKKKFRNKLRIQQLCNNLKMQFLLIPRSLYITYGHFLFKKQNNNNKKRQKKIRLLLTQFFMTNESNEFLLVDRIFVRAPNQIFIECSTELFEKGSVWKPRFYCTPFLNLLAFYTTYPLNII